MARSSQDLEVQCTASRVGIAVSRLVLRLLRLLVNRVNGSFCFAGLKLHVPKGCFAPVFMSTFLLLNVAAETVAGRLGCDVGAGCGAIALSLIRLTGVEMIGTDIDLKCLKASAANAALNEVGAYYHPVVCAEASCLRSESVDFVVTNPPYLPLKPEKTVDLALCGGERLEIFQKILYDAVRVVRQGGILIFTFSSLSGKVEGAQMIGKKKTPLDTIYAYVYKIK